MIIERIFNMRWILAFTPIQDFPTFWSVASLSSVLQTSQNSCLQSLQNDSWVLSTNLFLPISVGAHKKMEPVARFNANAMRWSQRKARQGSIESHARWHAAALATVDLNMCVLLDRPDGEQDNFRRRVICLHNSSSFLSPIFKVTGAARDPGWGMVGWSVSGAVSAHSAICGRTQYQKV